MAQLEKYNMMQAMAIIAHCERTGATHRNTNIDMTRTEMNYALWPISDPDRLVMDTPVMGQSSGKYAYRRLRKRLAEVSCLQREDVNVLCDWCLHLGADVPPGFREKREFFRAAVLVLANLYGPENVVYAWVHEDEEHSHLHFGFVPVIRKPLKLRKNASEATKKAYEELVSAGQKTVERVDANALITLRHLLGWHGAVTQRMVHLLGYDPGIHTGITNYLGGNMRVEDLKRTSPDWREKRNAAAAAFHAARRAKAAGEPVPLEARLTAAQCGQPQDFDSKLRAAKQRAAESPQRRRTR